ncbi:MAG: DUF1638 domain-containing protein [Kiritimatiellaeota bacterium]|nr:DUF1638 domain-containing protein [Kiritimatiellota bacterium]
MNLKLIACSIFQREICAALATTPHVVDVEFIELGDHDKPDRLRAFVQSRIDNPHAAHSQQSARAYEAVLLAYGICGNAATGLLARDIPLVIPRAHDCATLLLGSREAFVKHFGDNPSHPFGCVGYFERGHNNCHGELERPVNDPEYLRMVAEYGEENARYIWETMRPPLVDNRALFITTPPTRGLPAEANFKKMAGEQGLTYEELHGHTGFLDALVNGPWDDADFLTVPPGHRVRAVYDQTLVMAAEPIETH